MHIATSPPLFTYLHRQIKREIKLNSLRISFDCNKVSVPVRVVHAACLSFSKLKWWTNERRRKRKTESIKQTENYHKIKRKSRWIQWKLCVVNENFDCKKKYFNILHYYICITILHTFELHTIKKGIGNKIKWYYIPKRDFSDCHNKRRKRRSRNA